MIAMWITEGQAHTLGQVVTWRRLLSGRPATSGEYPVLVFGRGRWGGVCGERVAVIYGPGKYFWLPPLLRPSLREPYDLRYESQRENKMHRALKRAQNVRERLGGSANMREQFPKWSKGMHHDTYMKLFWEHQEAEMEHLTRMWEWPDKKD
jgi:hypothetical protein